MKKRLILTWLICLAATLTGGAQTFGPDDRNADQGPSWRVLDEEADTIERENVPIGFYTWHIDPRFGEVEPCPVDTLPHLFQNKNFTIGSTGHYNTLGNLGSPRLSRLYFERDERMTHEGFIFSRPMDFFLTDVSEVAFTNTKSPVANITYDECGNKTNGEDRIRALFSTNVNKRLGVGFILDYLYGRGYYASQSTAFFNGTLFGSYRSDRYSLHTLYSSNYLKMNENGGLSSDRYLTNPEAFPQKYGSRDMPTRLSKVRNNLSVQTFYLTQRYNTGYETFHVDSAATAAQLKELELKLGADSAKAVAKPVEVGRFVPVASFIHTLRVDHNYRELTIHKDVSDFFANYYWPGDSTRDKLKYLRVSNLVAVEVNEGFKPWLKSGLRLFAQHELERVDMPDTLGHRPIRQGGRRFVSNYITVGAQLFKREGRAFHYDLTGELTTTGKTWGIFNVEGHADLNLRLGADTLRLGLSGRVANEQPSVFFRHVQTQHAWWDLDLDNQFTARVGAHFRYKDTRLDVSLASLQNYTYFASTAAPFTLDNEPSYLHGVTVRQYNKNLQVAAATLAQDLKFGIFHWDTELTFQASSHSRILPLPLLSAYTNVYLKFRIARVLGTELGADLRYFTSYYAPDYSPEIGQYSTQAASVRVKTGNYPFVNVYANFHLKSCRFYIMAQHVNEGFSNKRYFMTPHYPMNPMTINLGVSWTFYN